MAELMVVESVPLAKRPPPRPTWFYRVIEIPKPTVRSVVALIVVIDPTVTA
jgi:hypothetical protein